MFLRNVWFRVAQDALHHLVRSAHRIQVRGETSPERVPSIPRQSDSLESWPNHAPPEFVGIDLTSVTGLKNDARLRITIGITVIVLDFDQGSNEQAGVVNVTHMY